MVHFAYQIYLRCEDVVVLMVAPLAIERATWFVMLRICLPDNP